MATIDVPAGYALVLGTWGIGCGLILNMVVRYGMRPTHKVPTLSKFS